MGGLLGGCKGYVDPPLKLLGGGGGGGLAYAYDYYAYDYVSNCRLGKVSNSSSEILRCRFKLTGLPTCFQPF